MDVRKELGMVALVVGLLVGVKAITSVNTVKNVKTKAAGEVSNIVAIGDSITFGHKDCVTINGVISCSLEPKTYEYWYANYAVPTNRVHFNYAESMSKASCPTAGCPTFDTDTTTNCVLRSSYAAKGVSLPDDLTKIQVDNNLRCGNIPGVARYRLGQWSGITGSEVLMAYGRNDVNALTTSIGIEDFRKALLEMTGGLQTQGNKVTLLTIPPMNQSMARYYRRTEFNDRINNLSWPVELDTFFSAMAWEVAYLKQSYLVPVSEYFLKYPNAAYFSSDGIHPSAVGQQLIFNTIRDYKGVVSMASTGSVKVGAKFLVTSASHVFGQIVTRNADGSFYYAEPIELWPGKPYIGYKMRDNTVVYALAPVQISDKVDLETRTYANLSGRDTDSVTAYGRAWNWWGGGIPWLGNGFDLTTVGRFVAGPCAGKSVGGCKLDTRAFINSGGQMVESITAYGRAWNWTGGVPWPNNGFDLTTISRYKSGPCAGVAAGTCKFDTRAQFGQVESITAYGRAWNWNSDGSAWPNNGFDLKTISRYATGPCAAAGSGACTFQTRTPMMLNGKMSESITAYGGEWNW